jgi:hypothetical protein
LKAALIRLEEDQTKNSEARTIPLPNVLVKMLERAKTKTGPDRQDESVESVAQGLLGSETRNPSGG